MEEATSNSVSEQCLTEYSAEELKQLVVHVAVELESVRACAQSQREIHEAQIGQMEELLESVRRERNEIKEQCMRLAAKLIQVQPVISSNTEYNNNSCVNTEYNHSRPDSQSNNVQGSYGCEMLVSLPEKGRFLEAVLQAGPLLQTLLVAGPLPQWKCPPPSFLSLQFPPPPPPPLPPPSMVPEVPGFLYDCHICKNGGVLPQNDFAHVDDQNLCVGNGNVNAGFSGNSTYSNEDCHDSQTASTATKPVMGNLIQLQNNRFGSDRICNFVLPPPPPTTVWNGPFF